MSVTEMDLVLEAKVSEKRQKVRYMCEVNCRTRFMASMSKAAPRDLRIPSSSRIAVADRGGAVVNRPLGAIPGNEDGVIRQPDDCAFRNRHRTCRHHDAQKRASSKATFLWST